MSATSRYFISDAAARRLAVELDEAVFEELEGGRAAEAQIRQQSSQDGSPSSEQEAKRKSEQSPKQAIALFSEDEDELALTNKRSKKFEKIDEPGKDSGSDSDSDSDSDSNSGGLVMHLEETARKTAKKKRRLLKKKDKAKKLKKRRKNVVDSNDGNSSTRSKSSENKTEEVESANIEKKDPAVVELDDSEEEVEEETGVDNMFDRCEDISKRMRENLKDKEKTACITREYAEEILTPPGMSLKDYQLVGVNWLRVLCEESVNGILADEMGLGKTVQALMILSYMKHADGIAGPHLVIAPGSTLENWRREVSNWLPWARVEVYHGSQRRRRELAREIEPRRGDSNLRVDVLISTYTYFERDGSVNERAFLSKFPFEYIIYDEAHGIKRMNSSRYRRLLKLSSKRKLLLSGTPIQNNLQELLALMSFCMPDVFDVSNKEMLTYFDESKNNSVVNHTQRIREALRPFVLRRLKADVLAQLSPKLEETEMLEMIESQDRAYQRIVKSFRKKNESDEDSSSHFFSQLRKAANHPLLVRTYFGKSAEKSPDGVDRSVFKVLHLLYRVNAFGAEATMEMIRRETKNYSDWDFHLLALEFGSRNSELREMQLPGDSLWKSCKTQRLKELTPRLIEEGHRILIFSQWTTLLDLIEEVMGQLLIKYVRFDGQTQIGARQDVIDQFNEDMSISVCLLSTRAGGMGINLTSADTVILHDLDFNPSIDRQAEDRCHRIGQKKTVRVIKFVTKDTVDENILHIQTRKKKLDASLLKKDRHMVRSSSSSSSTLALTDSTPEEIIEEMEHEDHDPIKIIMEKLLRS